MKDENMYTKTTVYWLQIFVYWLVRKVRCIEYQTKSLRDINKFMSKNVFKISDVYTQLLVNSRYKNMLARMNIHLKGSGSGYMQLDAFLKR